MRRPRISTLVVSGAILGLVSGFVALRGALAPAVRAEVVSTLPTAESAKTLLNLTHEHREWITVPILADRSVLAWVVHPERTDSAPVVMLTGGGLQADEWTRAVSVQLAAEGYLVAVPDVLTEVEPNGDRHTASPAVARDRVEVGLRFDTVRQAVVGLPAARDAVVRVDLRPAHRVIEVRTQEHASTFALSAAMWPAVVDFLNRETGNRSPAGSAQAHADHMAMMQAQVGGSLPRDTLASKDPRLPAGFYTARAALRDTKLRTEWVDIPLEGETTTLHTFVVYPASTARSGVVLVMQHGVGLDEWQRALAVQVAEDGFIAVAPDLWSARGRTAAIGTPRNSSTMRFGRRQERSRWRRRCAATRRQGHGR